MSTQPNWSRKLWAIVFVIFCAEIGCFLLIYPWTEVWETNSLLSFMPQFDDVWFSGYFRGALSGLGLLNLYIAVSDTFRLKRFRKLATEPRS